MLETNIFFGRSKSIDLDGSLIRNNAWNISSIVK